MTAGLTELNQRAAQHLVDQFDELDESFIEYKTGSSLVDLTFEPSDFDEYETYDILADELPEYYKRKFRNTRTDYCPHHEEKDSCITTATYEQGAGFGMDALIHANLSGGEVVKVCTECGLVIEVIREASATGEGPTLLSKLSPF